MEIEGEVLKVLEERTGTSSFTGESWRIATYLIETRERNPKRIVFDVSDGYGGRIDRLNIQKGKVMRFWIDIDAHEYQGKWFNQIRCYDAREIETQIVEMKGNSEE